jgi:4-hydroxybenzoate polyprenyltransferase
MDVRKIESLVQWGRLVRFSHTIFALPFAASMGVVVARDYAVTFVQVGWILVALVSARCAAMAFNRIVDRSIDAQNPRTVDREIPRGTVSVKSAKGVLIGSIILFMSSAGMLGMHCLVLAPLVLGVLLGYSYTKRFTAWAHVVLGIALAAAPGGVWYALTGVVAWQPVWMMAGVLFWVAGFDILYALQDMEFDKKVGLFSIPSRWGARRSIQIARVCEALAVLCLLMFGYHAQLSVWYHFGVFVFAILVFSQFRYVHENDFRQIDQAFFVRNGLASVLFFLITLLSTIY